MNKYEQQKSGGEEAIERTRDEAVADEERRLGPFEPAPRRTIDISYLRLLPSLPDNVFRHRNPPDQAA